MLKVGQIMTRRLVTVSPDAPLERARWLVREHEVRHLPVVEHERLSGIVSERDLMERTEATPRCMLENGFHALPVLVNGALRGIVTSADVLAALRAIDEDELESAWTGEAALSAEATEEQ